MLAGANRRKVDAIFRELGGTITSVPGTDDFRYHHPKFPYPIKVSGGRKDCPRLLTKFVMRLVQAT